MCVQKSNHEQFNDANVYGNSYDSDIHPHYVGVYACGHEQGDWRKNKMYDDSLYGFDTVYDASDFLSIHGKAVNDNGYHELIASNRCDGVSIQVHVTGEGKLCSAGGVKQCVSGIIYLPYGGVGLLLTPSCLVEVNTVA